MWLVFLLYALFASVFTVSKEALQYAEPFFLVGFRMVLAGGGMLLYQLIRRQQITINARAWKKILLLAICNIYLTNVFEFWGLKYLTSFKTCFIYSLSPFISACFSYVLFRERMSKRKWIGLCIGFAGFLPILMSQTVDEKTTGQLWIFSWAELSVIAATISSVYGWILLKQLVQEEGGGISPITANGISMLIGGGCALTHSLCVETWSPIPVSSLTAFCTCTLFLIIVSNCICYNLYGFLLKRFSATFMSFAGLTTALFTAFFGWFIRAETPSIHFWTSFLIVCFGLVVFYQEELQIEREGAYVFRG